MKNKISVLFFAFVIKHLIKRRITMSTQKCLWDSSHTFEAPDDGAFRPLCPACYHNIYKGVYQKTISLNDFLSDIKTIKKAHKYVVLTEGYYTGIIAKMAISKIDG